MFGKKGRVVHRQQSGDGVLYIAFCFKINIKYEGQKHVIMNTHTFVANPEAQLQNHKFYGSSDSKSYRQNFVGKIYFSPSEGRFNYF